MHIGAALGLIARWGECPAQARDNGLLECIASVD